MCLSHETLGVAALRRRLPVYGAFMREPAIDKLPGYISEGYFSARSRAQDIEYREQQVEAMGLIGGRE